MDKKTSFILYPADFLAAVHNFRKTETGDLIIALCEFNLYGKISIKISEVVQDKFDVLQKIINSNNAKYKEICEKRQASGSKGGSKSKAKIKQNDSKPPANQSKDSPTENESDIESDKENESDNDLKIDENKEPVPVDKPVYAGAPSIEDVAAYCQESGYTIDPKAFVRWNEERGWMNGKKYIAVDWRKAVRKWFCKENGLEYSEMETMADICADVLGKVKVVQND